MRRGSTTNNGKKHHPNSYSQKEHRHHPIPIFLRKPPTKDHITVAKQNRTLPLNASNKLSHMLATSNLYVRYPNPHHPPKKRRWNDGLVEISGVPWNGVNRTNSGSPFLVRWMVAFKVAYLHVHVPFVPGKPFNCVKMCTLDTLGRCCGNFVVIIFVTLPKTNSNSPWKWAIPKGK